MFGIGISEIILIFLVIVVIIRPDDLPKFLRGAARFYAKAKMMYREIITAKDQIIKEIDDATTLDETTAPKAIDQGAEGQAETPANEQAEKKP